MTEWKVYSPQVTCEFAAAPVNSDRWKSFFQRLTRRQTNHKTQTIMKEE